MSAPATTAGPAAGTDAGRSSVLLSASAALVGALSYGCALVMAHLLPPAGYSAFAAAQTLLTIVGTVAAALVPLPLAHAVRVTAPGSVPRRRAVAAAVRLALGTGVVAALGTGAIALGFAAVPVATAVAASALIIAALAPVWGWLQGEGRFGRYAAATVAEAALRVLLAVALVLAGAGAAGAVGAAAAGALAVAACGASWLRRDLRPAPGPSAASSGTAEIALTQLVLSALVGADVLLVATFGDTGVGAAGFQALATLAKGPVYLAAGTVVVLFPLLRTDDPGAGPALRRALGVFARIALLAAVLLATVPAAVVGLVLPAAYLPALVSAPWLALAGIGYGTVMVGTTVLLALRRTARTRATLAAAAGLIGGGLGAGLAAGGVAGLAVGGALGALAAAAVTAVAVWPDLPAGTAGVLARTVLLAGVAVAALALARPLPLVWTAVAGVVAAVAVAGLRGRPSPDPVPGARLRILHLAFEDPAMPGSGGGALRTRETARRIAAAPDVTVLVQRYPGCVPRVEDGVRYEHVGFGRGATRLTRLLSYVTGLPAAVRGREADLVVEDFFAPVSTMAAPLWTGRPTIGVVQWLNAREKAAQYRMPVHLVERFGVRRHRRVVAVSAGLREHLLALHPGLVVDVIGNGVDPSAFAPPLHAGDGVVFVGRLEIAQKGLDLLLDAWQAASPRTGGDLVIAGTGPDERRLRERVTALGLDGRVRFAGWVDGPAKHELLAGARVVAVPSRFETFGIVAVEAAAAGTPVVAFDIDCLREVVPPACGRLVPAFDVAAYADALAAACDEAYSPADAAARRALARRHDWDAVAARQEQVYREAVAGR